MEKIKIKDDEEVFLITWDHGSAFGIFRELTPPLSSVIRRKPIDEELERFPYLNEFWQKALEETTFNDFIKKEKEKIPDPIIQSGHNLYKFSNKEDKKKHFIKILLNQSLNKFLEVKKIEGQTPKLIFKKEKISKSEILKEEESLKELLMHEIPLEEKVSEILRNNELSNSIKCWLARNKENKKVGVLLMMNCWMMNLHTMYSLKDTVECLVAPQGDIAIPGYNYRDILRYIYKPKSYYRTNQKLAKKCVLTCENKLAKKRADKIYKKLNNDHLKIDSWKIIAVDLQKKDNNGLSLFLNQINLLKSIIDILNTTLKNQNSEELKCMLTYIRFVSFDYTNLHSRMIDIINWLITIVNAANYNFFLPFPPEAKTPISKLIDITVKTKNKSNLILAISKGELIFDRVKWVISLKPTGYSLFFPQRILTDANLIDNFQNDVFLNEFLTNWKIFLTNLNLTKT